MSGRAGWARAVAAALLGTALISGPFRDHSPATADQASPATRHWVHTWTAMPQLTEPHNMPPAPFTDGDTVLRDATLRQTIHVSVGGDRLRLRFSNAFGGAPLPITKAVVALPQDGRAGVSGIVPGSSKQLTFSGRPSTVIPAGAQYVTDPVKLDVAPQSNLTVSVHLAEGQASSSITSHPGSRTSSYLLAGDHAEETDLPGATRTDHWYFLSGAEILSSETTAAVAMLGDSLTDGRGSTTNGNDRWPDRLLARLQDNPETQDVAVLNQAAGGNRVLADGLGPNALGRLDRDVLAHSGVRWLVVLHGINDIGTAEATPEAQHAVVNELIAAYEQIMTRAHADGIRVYGATLLPFGGSFYDDAGGHREAARQRVNEWIRTSDGFDEVVDLERAVADPADPGRLRPEFDDGDHLHLNPAGYDALGAAVPTSLFERVSPR
ncbi:SGNH/GDSL hydrolase family protein [Nocardioides sp. KC13]|uniref:SGNH/GDSL hydrolase family protein n=1 Tax=Nocardioides turkmenicus TaxID=2711220 RepID=A0A6M1R3Y5_9ACTN|nr:SGNH/GDSL hydrolase family protein [Nocardioides sp. KC13]NGN92448.1 SGNH/GDSL hydrolase family protein [Nocardioides sp. KC13]